MSVESHLAELQRRHQELKREIEAQETHHPSADNLELAELKRRKLRIKDEIERLRHQTAAETVH